MWLIHPLNITGSEIPRFWWDFQHALPVVFQIAAIYLKSKTNLWWIDDCVVFPKFRTVRSIQLWEWPGRDSQIWAGRWHNCGKWESETYNTKLTVMGSVQWLAELHTSQSIVILHVNVNNGAVVEREAMCAINHYACVPHTRLHTHADTHRHRHTMYN